MTTFRIFGGCHCGNLTIEACITAEPESYQPRACDCNFCMKHGASYVSDQNGSLRISVKDEIKLGRYRQGSGNARFLICKICGVLLAVYYQEQDQLYAAVNSKTVDGTTGFGPETVVSPKQLDEKEKIQRWQNIWFSDVRIILPNS